MKETASPPRTPNSHSPSDMKSHSPTAPALVTQPTPDDSASSSSQLLTAPPTFALPLSEQAAGSGKSQLDIDFPKLTPPKTKWNSSSSPPGSNTNTATRNHNRKSVSSDTSSNNNSICEDGNESQHMNDTCNKASQQKTGSQISNSSTNNNNNNNDGNKKHVSESENDHNSSVMSAECKLDERECMSPCKSPSNPSGNNYTQNDNNNNSGSKSSSSGSFITVKGKPPLKNMGSSSSCEGGNTSSGFISRDSSSEQFVDQNGIDLVQFFKETLNKNAKDRNMLLKIERDLISLAVDQT
jgi:a component of the cytoplasm (encore)